MLPSSACTCSHKHRLRPHALAPTSTVWYQRPEHCTMQHVDPVGTGPHGLSSQGGARCVLVSWTLNKDDHPRNAHGVQNRRRSKDVSGLERVTGRPKIRSCLRTRPSSQLARVGLGKANCQPPSTFEKRADARGWSYARRVVQGTPTSILPDGIPWSAWAETGVLSLHHTCTGSISSGGVASFLGVWSVCCFSAWERKVTQEAPSYSHFPYSLLLGNIPGSILRVRRSLKNIVFHIVFTKDDLQTVAAYFFKCGHHV